MKEYPKYKPSTQVEHFDITSFVYHDGPKVIDKIKPGTVLDIYPEFDNPYDPNALALYFKGVRVGYIPRAHNWMPAQMFRFGHEDVFEVRVISVSLDKDPAKQLHAGLYIVDKS